MFLHVHVHTTIDLTGCGDAGSPLIATFNEDNLFASPGYPDGYFRNLHCLWRIQASSGYVVVLSFDYFRVDPEDSLSVSEDGI